MNNASNIFEFKLPQLGENVDSADVTQVLVSVGDTIESEQPVLELENEKATFELPCPHAGEVLNIYFTEGDTVSVGDTIMTLTGEDVSTATPDGTVEDVVTSSERRTAESRPIKTGSLSPVQAELRPVARTSDPAGTESADTGPAAPPPLAGPSTRRLARELGVDLRQVTGTGASGCITEKDLQAFVRQVISVHEAGADHVLDQCLPDFSQWGQIDRKPLNKIARASADRLSSAWNLIPHVTQHEIADVTELETARKRSIQQQTELGPKITMTVLAVKASVAALKVFPVFNSSLDMASGELILKRYYHIGVAVDTKHGLLVPVIRDADRKTILSLADELTVLAEKGRNRKLSLNEMRGGTFTVTNLGGIGGTAFTPIINQPEVAVLGISQARWQQTVRDGQVETRLLLPLSLSYDHRVINGADGAKFIRTISSLLSDPFGLLSEC